MSYKLRPHPLFAGAWDVYLEVPGVAFYSAIFCGSDAQQLAEAYLAWKQS